MSDAALAPQPPLPIVGEGETIAPLPGRVGVRATAPGTVFLVGAGPGDPELITVAGLAALRRADVVVYDRLAAPALLREAPEGAALINAGKAPGAHALGQEAINALLAEQALAGRTVVRLKGGDPFLFGRGGEEALYLRERGIPFRVIPGVTSALAAPACAGSTTASTTGSCWRRRAWPGSACWSG